MSPSPYLQDSDFTLLNCDALEGLRSLEDESAAACVTSPPYLDVRPEYESPTLEEFAAIFRELRRVVTGPLLLDVGRIWRGGRELLWWTDLLDVAGAAGWPILDTLVWVKPNANPIRGPVFADSHEYVFALGTDPECVNTDAARTPYAESTQARLGRAWTNHRGVKQPRESRARKTRAEPNPLGARPRSYVAVCVGKHKGIKHPSPMALDFAVHLVGLACRPGEVVIDPFIGSGTTALAALKLGRRCIGIDNSADYCAEAVRRTSLQLSLESEVA